MTKDQAIYLLAGQLARTMANFRRITAQHMHQVEDGDATLVQITTLFHIIEHPTTVSDLARERKVSLQSASVHVQGLVERGWVVREPDPNDRRRSLLKATAEGQARASVAKDHYTQFLASLLDGLTEEEIAAGQMFTTALQRLIENESHTSDC
jgi:DNA-binding MarR family transcriptional regulator